MKTKNFPVIKNTKEETHKNFRKIAALLALPHADTLEFLVNNFSITKKFVELFLKNMKFIPEDEKLAFLDAIGEAGEEMLNQFMEVSI